MIPIFHRLSLSFTCSRSRLLLYCKYHTLISIYPRLFLIKYFHEKLKMELLFLYIKSVRRNGKFVRRKLLKNRRNRIIGILSFSFSFYFFCFISISQSVAFPSPARDHAYYCKYHTLISIYPRLFLIKYFHEKLKMELLFLYIKSKEKRKICSSKVAQGIERIVSLEFFLFLFFCFISISQSVAEI